MQRALICSLLSLGLVAGTACGKDRNDAKARPSLTDVAGATADKGRVEVTGCLAADPQTRQFVLTAHSNALSALANRAAAGEAETFHYELVGGSDLQSMVGKEVRVIGDVAGKGKDVDIKRTERSTEPEKAPGVDATAAVKTTEQIEMQVERLKVASITPTGSACQSAP
jgi:hypothetical protein